jgi:hypothetical protein
MGLFNQLFNQRSKVKLSSIDYNKYFDNSEIEGIPLELLPLGELSVPSGEIVVCDPLVNYGAVPLTRKVKPGTYPVTVCIAQTEQGGERIAVAKLEFTKGKAKQWEMALIEGQDISVLNEADQYFGFPVDTGLGCFMDAETNSFYDELQDEYPESHEGKDIYDDLIAVEFKKNAKDQTNPNDIGDWLNFHLPNKPDLNIIMFQSGFGDGSYPSYWGVTENGGVCSLIIDFMVL